MKKTIKRSIAIAVLFTALLSYGRGVNPKSGGINSRTTTLTLRNVEKGNQLLVKDENGIILYKEVINKSGYYLKGFDLTALPNGKYFFELKKSFKTEIIPFVVENKKAKINKTNKDVVYKPYVRTKDNMIFVSKLTLKKAPLQVTIYYISDSTAFNGKIFSETISNTVDIQRVYKLDENKKGTYKIVLNTEGKTYIEYAKF